MDHVDKGPDVSGSGMPLGCATSQVFRRADLARIADWINSGGLEN
jgi:hypothetical protein